MHLAKQGSLCAALQQPNSYKKDWQQKLIGVSFTKSASQGGQARKKTKKQLKILL